MGKRMASNNGPAPRGLFAVVSGFALLAVFSYGFAAYDLFVTLPAEGVAYTLVDRDFANYWMGGRLALSGDHLDLFSQEIYFPYLQQMFGADYQIRNWGYPPHFLLFIWPLGYLSYKAALVAFLGSTFALFVLSAMAFRREFAPTAHVRVLALVLLGYSLMMFVTTQNGFLTSALMLFGLTWMKSKPTLAGFAFACLTIKPQIGLLIPVLLLFDRNWAAIVSAAVFTFVLALASTLTYGIESWHAYLTETIAYQRFVMTDWYGIFLRMMPTVFASLRTLDVSPSMAIAVQMPFSLGAALVVVWVLIHERDALRRAFVVLCGTFVVAPYAFNYDMGALSVAAVLLASAEARQNAHSRWWLAIALVAVLPASVMNLGRASLPIAPLVLVLGLAAVLFARFQQRDTGLVSPQS
jgi:hypothetical protein